MARTTSIHVVTRGTGWAITRAGAARASRLVDTQKQGFEEGRAMARKAGSELVVHGRDGRIREKNSYGNDPCPPKDKR